MELIKQDHRRTLIGRKLLPLLIVMVMVLSGANARLTLAWVEPPTRSASLVPTDCGFPDCELIFLPAVNRPEAQTTLDRATARDLYIKEYLPSQSVSAGWTGSRDNCTPGTTSQAFRDAVLRRVNYFREMAGVPKLLGFNDEKNRQAQAAALMMSANNNLNHYPPTSWACYSADGKTAAGSSNLALGSYGPSAITGYMFDYGAGNTAAGHRRWLLNPPTQTMGSGDIPSGSSSASNALFVFDASAWGARPATRDEFVAWPPKGYAPYPVVNSRWSFAYPGADFSGAQVTLNSDGAAVAITRYSPANGYGENALVWQINGISEYSALPRPAGDKKYTVSISNVIIGGAPKSFSYDVIIFDPAT